MAVVKACFEITVEMPDEHAEWMAPLNFEFSVFEDELPEEWEVVLVKRVSVERVD